ncbi:hypothetical protein SLEP1_g9590 [Rubroshorea leprosula]|uniref:Uncharacterized protein n=1 Tax=Rubroshorea leprosula TaxID=152421 RepID=A0AAV5I9W1_9ROSI|nr:hypothetical protein SLEP1_g9590 [Rubroshorea leprosula]
MGQSCESYFISPHGRKGEVDGRESEGGAGGLLTDEGDKGELYQGRVMGNDARLVVGCLGGFDWDFD